MALDGTTPPATPPGDGGTPPAAPPAAAWYETLPADILNDDIKAFKGPDELAKAYIDTKGKVPTVPDKYEFQFPTEFDKEYIDHAQSVAKEIGLTQDQFARLAKHDVDSLAKMTEESVAAQKGAVEALRKEWGVQTNERVTKANAVLTAILGETWATHFEIDKHPEVLKAFYSLSTKLSEDMLRTPGSVQSGGLRTGADGNPILSYPNTPSMQK